MIYDGGTSNGASPDFDGAARAGDGGADEGDLGVSPADLPAFLTEDEAATALNDATAP